MQKLLMLTATLALAGCELPPLARATESRGGSTANLS